MIDFVEQRDVQRNFRDPVSNRWTVVEESNLDEDTSIGRSALFVEPDVRPHVIERGPGWPRGFDGGPAFVEYWGEDDRRREYLPTGNDEGPHPLVLTQKFYGLKPDPLPRLIDEFVLFHNLWRDDETAQYFKMLDDGRSDPAAYFEKGQMLVRTDLLRQFQAARQWDLVICIDARRLRLPAPGVEVDTIRTDVETDLENTCLVGGTGYSTGSFTRFFGVRAIPAPPFEKAGSIGFGDRESEDFPELIVDIDADGGEVRVPCGPDLPPDDFLQTVHFRREVLAPYYERPDIFTIDESGVTCGNLWSFRVHGAAPGNLFAHIGDFASELPEAERIRWSSFNEPPGQSSTTNPLRQELANHAMAKRGIDFEFQRRYRALNEGWERRFGWPLFTAPTGEDLHLIRRVRVPLNDGTPEFEEQLGVLARLTVEPLNTKAISKIVDKGEANEQSISKLERLLELEEIEDTGLIAILRDLQQLRSKISAHKRSSKADDVIRSTLGTTDTVAGIMKLLIRLCESMLALENHC